MPDAQILLYDGFDELDAIAPFEVLAAAGFRCELVVDGDERSLERPVVATHGLRVLPDAALAARPDVLIVPGGGWAARSSAGTWAEHERGVLPAAIAARHAAGSVVASVCTGAMLLARGGLLTGRPAVTHRVALADLAAAGADVRPEARVVDDGDLLTGGGVTSGLDVALRLVERFAGADAARFGALRMEYEPRVTAVG
ncbi:DJ-1/PfpI family protein [Patulibacter defluvii]|uniref:DJ-1/PfpI family protein n=1 Tax=Patulibacter defluvii TaxID=3095358 RepID=UPI002A756E87|nr:DJ-1/PfpI family protein [Patulibacter sp. DM4]